MTKITRLSIIFILLLSIILPIIEFPAPAHAISDRFWVGRNGVWSNTTCWSATSGNLTGGASIPDSATNVHFDNLSFDGAGQVVTVDVAANCLDMDWTGATNTPTLNFNANLDFYGTCTFLAPASMSITGSYKWLQARGTGTLYTAGQDLGNVVWIKVQTAGTLTLGDNFVGYIDVYAGTFTTANFSVTCASVNGSFNDEGHNGAKTLNLGTSTITTREWSFTGTGLTLTDSAYTINVTNTGAFAGGGYSYRTVNLNGTAHTISGSNTFVNLTRNGTATKTDTLTLTSGTTQTVTGTCALIGNSATNRLLVQSSTLGTAATITLGAGAICRTGGTDKVDFMDVTMTGGAANERDLSAIAGYSGDCGGNTGITFTASAAQTSASTDTWSTAAKWTSRVPLPQDDVTCSHNTTVDMPRIGKSITFTGTPTITLGNLIAVYGSLTLAGTWSNGTNYTTEFRGRGSYNFTSANKSLGAAWSIYAPNGTLTILDNPTFTGWTGIQIYNGALDITNRTITFTASGRSGTGWRYASSSSLISTGSTLVMADTGVATYFDFAGGSQTYNNVTVQGAGNYILTVTGNNTFNTVNVDRSVAAKTLTLTANTNQTMANFISTSSGTRVLTINATAPAIFQKTGGSGVMVDYVSLLNNTGSPANTWYYGLNNTIGANVTGWNAGAVPLVTTVAASTVEETTATGNGNLTNLNYSEPATEAGIEYDIKTGAPYAFNAHTHGTYPVGVFSQALAGLTQGTTYYYRAYAIDMAGTGYGAELTFLTKPEAPTAFTVTPGSPATTLTWVKGVASNNTVIYARQNQYPTGIADPLAVLAYNGTAASTSFVPPFDVTRTYYRAWGWTSIGALTQYSDLFGQGNTRGGMVDFWGNIISLTFAGLMVILLIGVTQMKDANAAVKMAVAIAILTVITLIIINGVLGS